MFKTVSAIVVAIIVCLVTQTGYAATDRWYSIQEGKEYKVFLDTVSFSSSLDDKQQTDEYFAECWTKIIKPSEKKWESKHNFQIKIDVKTMKIQMRKLQVIVLKDGETYSSDTVPGTWENAVPESRGENICFDIFNYDLNVRHKAQ